MKRLYPISFLLFVFSCEDKEDNEVITFVKTFGFSGHDIGYSVQQTTDGGYILSGRKEGNQGSNLWLIKTDSEGNEVWNHTFGRNNIYYGNSAHQTADGGYVITGYKRSWVDKSGDVWLIKTNSSGKEEWNRTFGGSGYEIGNSGQQTIDGGYIIIGSINSWDVWLIKTDSDGNEEWDRTFGGGGWDMGRSVQQTSDGGYIITGFTSSFGKGRSDVWLIKTDSQGIEEWNQTFGGSHSDEGNSVQQTIDGGYIISGDTYSFGSGAYDVWLIKTDSQGSEKWNKTFGGSRGDRGHSVQQTEDGGFIITGTTRSLGNNHDNCWLIKTNAEGNEEWNRTFGGNGSDGGISVQQTTDGGYIISGYTDSFGNGSTDIWLIKTDTEGNTVPYK